MGLKTARSIKNYSTLQKDSDFFFQKYMLRNGILCFSWCQDQNGREPHQIGLTASNTVRKTTRLPQQPAAGRQWRLRNGNAADIDSIMCWSQKAALHFGPHARNANDRWCKVYLLLTLIIRCGPGVQSYVQKKKPHVDFPYCCTSYLNRTPRDGFCSEKRCVTFIFLTSRRKSESGAKCNKTFLIHEHLCPWIASNRYSSCLFDPQTAGLHTGL